MFFISILHKVKKKKQFLISESYFKLKNNTLKFIKIKIKKKLQK